MKTRHEPQRGMGTVRGEARIGFGQQLITYLVSITFSIITACVDALDAFLRGCQAAGGELPLDIATEELRIAAKELGQITGTIQVEEVLDVVFEEFCIGK